MDERLEEPVPPARRDLRTVERADPYFGTIRGERERVSATVRRWAGEPEPISLELWTWRADVPFGDRRVAVLLELPDEAGSEAGPGAGPVRSGTGSARPGAGPAPGPGAVDAALEAARLRVQRMLEAEPRIRRHAAEELFPLARDWSAETAAERAEDGGTCDIVDSAGQLFRRITLASLTCDPVHERGIAHYDDDDIFLGHAITVDLTCTGAGISLGEATIQR
jgi:Uncharacterized protein conserved in bacteria (DUF2262)